MAIVCPSDGRGFDVGHQARMGYSKHHGASQGTFLRRATQANGLGHWGAVDQSGITQSGIQRSKKPIGMNPTSC